MIYKSRDQVCCGVSWPSKQTGSTCQRHCILHKVLFCTLQGVWERDELRKDDSFETFAEVFKLAHTQNVRLLAPHRQ